MLIPIYKIGDVLVPKAKKDPEVTNIRDIWIFCAKHTEAKSADGKTEEFISYTAIVSVEHCEYMTLRDFDEMELVSEFRRIGHNDISEFIPEGDEQDKSKDGKEAQIKTLNAEVEYWRTKAMIKTMLANGYEKDIKDLNEQLRIAYGCIDRFTIDAVAGMRRAGCSVEKIAKTLNMPEQAVRVYLNAADVLDCKEDE